MKKQQLIRVGAIVAVAGVSFAVLQKPGAAPSASPIAMAEAAVPTEAPQPVPAQLVVVPAGPVVLPINASAEVPTEATAEVACNADMVLLPQPGAMLDLGLLAPCQAGSRVMIRHGELVVSGKVSSAGSLIASIPAFASPAEVSISFADGSSVAQSAEVPDLAEFNRFAVQWMAGDDFALHGFEKGADYGAPGHISAATPGKPGAEASFLSTLGDASTERALLAEIYSWPATQTEAALSLEAEVTEQSCGREILGETLFLSQGQLDLRELSIEMPSCDAVGEFVVLPNPAAPEKLAAN